MIGVFRHRPVGNRDVVPEIRRACHAEIAFRSLLPVFRPASAAIRRNDLAADLDGVRIEIIIVPDGGKPDVFRAVFPVVQRAASFFSLPGDAVADFQMFPRGRVKRGGALPVAAKINRRRRRKKRHEHGETAVDVLEIGVIGDFGEFEPVEILVEIVRRIKNQQIERALRQQFRNFK